MYHSVGGVVASGAVLLGGGAVILREKFSARAFWDDVADSGATIFQYIGELCRYLLKPTREPRRRTSCAWPAATACRAMSGRRSRAASPFRRSWNSMPPPKAISRSTMRKAKPGAIGRIPRLSGASFRRRPDRGVDDGRRAAAGTRTASAGGSRRGEAGEAIGKIAGGAARFEGYTDAAATAKKILRDVFEAGRCLGAHRRSDAPGRAGLLLFRGPDRRHLPLEGRECRHHRSGRGAGRLSRRQQPPTSMAWRCRARTASAAWRRWKSNAGFDLAGLPRPSGSAPAGLCPAAVPAAGGQRWPSPRPSSRKSSIWRRKASIPPRIADPLLCRSAATGYVPLDAALYARISSGLIRL